VVVVQLLPAVATPRVAKPLATDRTAALQKVSRLRLAVRALPPVAVVAQSPAAQSAPAAAQLLPAEPRLRA
jgi:hypothetical protein